MALDQGAGQDGLTPHEDDRVLAGLREAIESEIVKSLKKTILTCLLIWVLQRTEITRRSVHSPRLTWRAVLAAIIVPIGYVAYHDHAWHLIMQLAR